MFLYSICIKHLLRENNQTIKHFPVQTFLLKILNPEMNMTVKIFMNIMYTVKYQRPVFLILSHSFNTPSI